LSLLDQRPARVYQPIFLLAEVLLAGVLLVVEEETVLVVSELLEKRGMILQGSVTLEEGEALLFSGASLVTWYSWDPFFLVGWTGGHRQSYFWSLPICQFANTTMKVL